MVSTTTDSDSLGYARHAAPVLSNSVDTSDSVDYCVYMARTPDADRMRIIDRAVLAHVLDHPARGRAWSLRELAAILGCSHATLGHLKSGERDTVSTALAQRLSDAVGCHVRVLFLPAVSTESEDAA